MGRAGAGTGTGGAAVAVAVAGLLLLLLLLARSPPAAAGDGRKSDARLVSEQFSQSPQKLAFYSWYGSTRLFRFRVPPDTVLLRWLLQASQGSGPSCTNVEITVYFRYGAPPVINPLGTSFPDNTSVQPSFLVKMLHGNTSINISHPAPGDWFVAAHLPPSSQKIEVKGFIPTCAYVFQPDMLVVRVVEVSILEPDVPLPQTLLHHPSYLKIFVPEYTQELRLELQGCASNGSLGCPVRLTVGSATLPGNFRKVLTCTGPTQDCRLLLPSPPWGRWLQVTAKSLAGPLVSVAFTAVAALTACRPWSVSFQHLLQNSANQSRNASTGLLPLSPSYQELDRSSGAGDSPFCLRNYPVPREDLDVVSVRFRPLDQVSVQSDMPSVLRLYLNTGMDSGGSLIISLQVNKTAIANNTLVVVCVTAASPFLSFNDSLNCTTAFFQGYPLSLSASSRKTTLVIPYPETDNWYLSLQLVCPESPNNLLFLAPITVSVHRSHLVEASVYAYTMFFSTFYHACDQPGEAVLCILNYDTLQYCDFLGSGVSIWVTILCMARLKAALKYVLFLLGTLVFAMSLQMDRRAVWNTMGPCLFAIVVMVTMWVYRCGRRRHCYPTSWQRWIFYLLPGISMATMAITIYTSMMTSDNYYYTHSIWHMLLAGSAAFLLPPREQHTDPWACSQKLPCHYEICKNHREELYTVT
ncbi:post-GPI attachment to proteins factor 6 isoform X4 [Camelus dromedarius]|uniref:post-GPI attachment to proteins factor 6 isoform X4 n=1 Tax=Camelus dromedarius TaxID=9838 RepID=UPI003119F73F